MFSLTQEHVTVWVQQLLGSAADDTGSKGVSFNMRQALWTLAFGLALIKTQLHFFHGGSDRNEALET